MFGEVGVSEEDRLHAGDAKRVLRRAWPILRPHRRRIFLACGLIVVWTATILAGPLWVKMGIDQGITQGDGRALNVAVAGFVITSVVAYVVSRVQIRIVGQVGEQFLRDLRERVFDHLLRLSMPYYDREKAGVVVSRMTSDVEAMQELVQFGLLLFVSNVLVLVGAVILLLLVSWQLLLICLVVVPPVVVASIKFQRDSNDAYLTVRDRIGSTLSSLQEGIAGVRIIQAFSREDGVVDRFAEHNDQLYDAHMRSVKVQAWYLPVIEIAGLGTTALVVGFGGWLTIEGVVTIGTVTFFVLTLSNLFEPVQQLSQLFNTVQSAGAGLQKLFDVLDTPVEVGERNGAVDLPEHGDIEVDHVSFAYGSGSPVLHRVDLRIAAGERLALVGPTGAGKSTLAKLIARLYDPVEGSIRYGGVDLRDATLRSLRTRMVVVPQEGFLFDGTVLDNVRIGRPEASDEEVAEALAVIGTLDRFLALPDGLGTEVQERGSRLSAGEKQLVSLSRAALADPRVLVLDEATSNLDPGTEVLVEAAVERLMEGRTVVVIAHRLTTAQRADRVGLVDAGGLAELGTHDELVAAGGRYAALFRSWTKGLAGTGA